MLLGQLVLLIVAAYALIGAVSVWFYLRRLGVLKDDEEENE